MFERRSTTTNSSKSLELRPIFQPEGHIGCLAAIPDATYLDGSPKQPDTPLLILLVMPNEAVSYVPAS